MIFLIYLFSSGRRKKVYRYLSRCYGASPYRVCALAKGRKVRNAKEYAIAGELLKRRLRDE